MTNQKQRAEAFKEMHAASRGFVMPNVWDAGSAIMLADAGFTALATTSAGIAFSFGKPDYDVRNARLAVSRGQMFDRIREIVSAVPLPVNGDLEDGYGERPEDVAETVRLAIAAGLAGGNIEDKNRNGAGLYEEALAVDRIRAARAAIDASGATFVLTARTDGFLVAPHEALATSIRRSNLFREAGADCLYPPGAADLETIKTLVREIGGPLNIVTGLGGMRIGTQALLDAGVQRISLGGSIARAALGFVRNAARELSEKGTLGFATGQIGQAELNALFARSAEN